MNGTVSRVLKLTALLAVLLWGTAVLSPTVGVQAQDDPDPTVARLFITSSDVSRLPNIELRLYGRDAQGAPLDLATTQLRIQQNGEPVGPISFEGTQTTGVFTLFLIDIPPGVAGQLPALQDALIQYASPGTMTEQVDSVAVYQVSAADPTELLAPTNFHNSMRNLFATPLTPETGPTALIDSTVSLLEQVETLKPAPEMAASIVLLTDGTDSVSTVHEPEDVAETAVRLGIPVHTIVLSNENLGDAAQQFGRDYLAEVAAATGGIAVELTNTENLPLIWERIAGFREQARVQFTATGLTAGEYNVVVALADDATIRDETAVTIPNNIPTITIELPADSRTLSLPSLEQPVTLRFNTTISWLDGEEREIEAAQLMVNDATAADIPADAITQFDVTLDSLVYGNNKVEVVLLDDQGMRAISPAIILTVEEGSRNIPDALRAGFDLGGVVRPLLIIIAMLVIAAVVWFLAWRMGWLSGLGALMPRGRSRPSSPQVTITDDSGSAASASASTPAGAPVGAPIAYLEVLEAASQVRSPVALRGATIRIGRSPAQADLPFTEDVTVSRRHATLMLEGRQYRIFDERSTSGTWVNERQVPEYGVLLRDGDEIHMGAVHLRYRQQA